MKRVKCGNVVEYHGYKSVVIFINNHTGMYTIVNMFRTPPFSSMVSRVELGSPWDREKIILK